VLNLVKFGFRWLDLAIRYGAVVVISTLGFALLLLVCIMGTDNGTATAFYWSAAIFVFGCGMLAATVLLAIVPQLAECWIPGPALLGKILVRIPVYPVGTAGMFLLIRQIWQVAIPELLG
jgi:hypothetical protein